MPASGWSLQRSINATPKGLVYAFGAIPGLWIFWLAVNDRLGADPLKTLEQLLGLWALRFIIAGLAVTPIRRLGGPNLIRYRRALGLLAFFYACAHLSVYLLLDQGLDAAAILRDIAKRPYVTIGMSAFAILVPLAVTSNNAMIRRLGSARWLSLHRWVYVAAIAAATHFIMSVKAWPAQPVVYAGIVAALLLFRAAGALRKRFASPAMSAAASLRAVPRQSNP